MPKQSWSTVKSAASSLSQKELLGLVGELYRLSSQNKAFLYARFADQGVAIEEFKAIVAESLYPDVSRDRPLQVAKAKKAVADFCKAVADPIAHADLMLFFLEQGNAFTLEYGDIDTGFYSALVAMARRAAEVICNLPVNLQEPFRERLGEVVRSSSGIGWGYHDDLADICAAAFPDRR
ncbi:hypothetical protein VB734_00355 [Synechococcus sp. BA-124 BA4]|uniref:hypothetical protein n=1 Tax=unclassified Synechococcus TaxID=2626047 RepID=UPI002AD3D48C|nr:MULTISPECIES: hypothetical protein [unclassified Synechococcus]MEA5398493.1 hypothetical protein [Synechococcus sp. BA-124 BA4]CAK6691766.1 hypothetical protein BBFGKLBO_01099 [Synechococcus sp. CBW1107]